MTLVNWVSGMSWAQCVRSIGIQSLSAVVVAVAMARGAAIQVACGAEPVQGDSAAAVRAHLAAGEFGAAIAAAEQAGADRDRLLRQVAGVQRENGAAAAAAETLGRIRDDRARAGAVADVLAQRIAPPNPVLAQFGGGGVGGGVGGGLGGGAGGQGNTQTADFDPIIELIQKTIEPASWDAEGGPGAIQQFAAGVLVDTTGVMKRIVADETSGKLEALRQQAATRGANLEVRKASPLRKVSLTRLEKEIQVLRAAGHEPDNAMRMLAGLQRIEYVLVYPETGDVVLAGPAGDWRRAAEGRVVSVDNGHPVLQLDDLVVILRHASAAKQARFGCSIDPLPENIARTQEFLTESAKRKLPPGAAAVKQYAETIRARMGLQKIDVFGIDPRTRVGRVLVEADYRMKLVGLGLEAPAGDLQSYFDSLGGKNPGLKLVRWWFTLNYDAVQATPDRAAFAIHGQGVQLQSENEVLAAQGRRVATGGADEMNERFAKSFTKNFPALAAKYPIYAELQNVFDLALAASLITSEKLGDKVNWHMSGLRDDSQYHVALGAAPQVVESVVRHRADGKGSVLVQVSGGVKVDTTQLVSGDKIETAESGSLSTSRDRSRPAKAEAAGWWWD